MSVTPQLYDDLLRMYKVLREKYQALHTKHEASLEHLAELERQADELEARIARLEVIANQQSEPS